MELTKYQRKVLRAAQDAREMGLSIAGILARAWKFYAVFLSLISGMGYFYWWGGWQLLALFIVGFGSGVLWRDLTLARLRVRLWPLSREITDWSKVSELLANDRPAP